MTCEITFKLEGDQSTALKMQRLLASMGATHISIKAGRGNHAIRSLQMNPNQSLAPQLNPKCEATLFGNPNREAA